MIKNVNKFLFTSFCDIIFTNHLLIYFIAKKYIYIYLLTLKQHINAVEDRKCFAITISAHFPTFPTFKF
jgi:hypothetical protein